MKENSKYYDVEDFNKWKRKKEPAYIIPPKANFLAAASHVRDFFEGKKFNWATFLSLQMLCLGSRRDMPDIHIVYDDRDFFRIKTKLEADQRVRLPKGMNSLFPSKLLVSTGPQHRDAGCTDNVDVEVVLVPPGSHETPPIHVLRNNQVMLRYNRDGKSESFKGLNMLYLVKTLICYCKAQDLVWDPRKDVLFLCQNYGKEIEAIQGQLNVRQVQENFLGTPFFSRLPPEEQRRCYRVLLGGDKQPPPIMSITPAPSMGHRHTASASDLSVLPRPLSHQSAPLSNATIQQSSDFLNPPLPDKPKMISNAPKGASSTSTSFPATLESLDTTNTVSTKGDSRSRYRRTSAPNPSLGRDVRPEMRAHSTSQLMPVGPQAAQRQRIIPIYAHSQHTAQSAHNKAATPYQTTSSIAQVAKVVAPRLTQSKTLPQGAQHSLYQDRTSKLPTTEDDALKLIQPISFQGYQPFTKHGTEIYEADSNPNILIEKAGTGSLQGSQSRGECYVSSPEGSGTQPKESATRVTSNHILKLEASPPRDISPRRGDTPSEFIAELPADTMELPADMMPRPLFAHSYGGNSSHDAMQISTEEIGAKKCAHSESHDDSPASIPVVHAIPAPVPSVPPEPRRPPPSPPNMQNKPDLFDALPPSLLAGVQDPRRRSPNGSIPQLSPPPSQPAISHTNATKYQRYYSPPSSASSSTHPSPKQVSMADTIYKAYSGPIGPSQPTKAPAKLQKPPSVAHIQASFSIAHAQLSNAQIPVTVSETGSHMPKQPGNVPYQYPNPLGAHPPTPVVTDPIKYASHKTHNDIESETGTASASVYTAFSYQEMKSQQDSRYVPFRGMHTTGEHHLETMEHENVYERSIYASPQLMNSPYEYSHHRSVSHSSQTSNASHDSQKLAMEYQQGLPDFENGYTSPKMQSEAFVEVHSGVGRP